MKMARLAKPATSAMLPLGRSVWSLVPEPFQDFGHGYKVHARDFIA
jgi:hypothetical protein